MSRASGAVAPVTRSAKAGGGASNGDAALQASAARERGATGAMGLVAALIAAASLVMVLWNLQDASLKNANTGSRYATVESLVDYGTYAIDKSRYRRTIDKVKIGDHYYSSKPPLLPTATAGVYWIYQRLTGRRIADYEGQVVWLGSLSTGWLSHLVLLIYLWRLGGLLLATDRARIGLLAAGAFAYLGAGYSTTLNNHSVAAALCVCGLFYALKVGRPGARRRDWWLAGAALGLLPGIDLPSAAVAAGLGGVLLQRDARRTLIHFAPPALAGVVVHLALTQLATGSIIPAYLRPELYDYPGSYWLNDQGIDALREPKGRYAFHVLLGHHGVFSMTPLLIPGVVTLARRAWRGPEAAAARAIAGATGLIVLFIIFWSHNYGGWCVGMRWLVPVMALWLVYFGVWLDGLAPNRVVTAGLFTAFCVSAFHVQDALSGPFQFSRWHNWLEGKPNRARTGDKMNLGRAGARGKRRQKGKASK